MLAKDMHTLMVQTAKSVGLPKHFVNDLFVHDLAGLEGMQDKGLTKFWWRLRESGTQFSSHSELYARMGWDDEQEHCYMGDLARGTLTKLTHTRDNELRQARVKATRF